MDQNAQTNVVEKIKKLFGFDNRRNRRARSISGIDSRINHHNRSEDNHHHKSKEHYFFMTHAFCIRKKSRTIQRDFRKCQITRISVSNQKGVFFPRNRNICPNLTSPLHPELFTALFSGWRRVCKKENCVEVFNLKKS